MPKIIKPAVQTASGFSPTDDNLAAHATSANFALFLPLKVPDYSIPNQLTPKTPTPAPRAPKAGTHPRHPAKTPTQRARKDTLTGGAKIMTPATAPPLFAGSSVPWPPVTPQRARRPRNSNKPISAPCKQEYEKDINKVEPNDEQQLPLSPSDVYSASCVSVSGGVSLYPMKAPPTTLICKDEITASSPEQNEGDSQERWASRATDFKAFLESCDEVYEKARYGKAGRAAEDQERKEPNESGSVVTAPKDEKLSIMEADKLAAQRLGLPVFEALYLAEEKNEGKEEVDGRADKKDAEKGIDKDKEALKAQIEKKIEALMPPKRATIGRESRCPDAIVNTSTAPRPKHKFTKALPTIHSRPTGKQVSPDGKTVQQKDASPRAEEAVRRLRRREKMGNMLRAAAVDSHASASVATSAAPSSRPLATASPKRVIPNRRSQSGGYHLEAIEAGDVGKLKMIRRVKSSAAPPFLSKKAVIAQSEHQPTQSEPPSPYPPKDTLPPPSPSEYSVNSLDTNDSPVQCPPKLQFTQERDAKSSLEASLYKLMDKNLPLAPYRKATVSENNNPERASISKPLASSPAKPPTPVEIPELLRLHPLPNLSTMPQAPALYDPSLHGQAEKLEMMEEKVKAPITKSQLETEVTLLSLSEFEKFVSGNPEKRKLPERPRSHEVSYLRQKLEIRNATKASPAATSEPVDIKRTRVRDTMPPPSSRFSAASTLREDRSSATSTLTLRPHPSNLNLRPPTPGVFGFSRPPSLRHKASTQTLMSEYEGSVSGGSQISVAPPRGKLVTAKVALWEEKMKTMREEAEKKGRSVSGQSFL
ncbi:hypothetical protein DFH27DRAFT_599884 [Peziza echinospora]|nr:hypothetical protein DFH27DRAFT_599884 [Peziza echinospora]